LGGSALQAQKESVPVDFKWVIDETITIINELPSQGDRRLLQLLCRVPEMRRGRNGSENSPLDQLRYLLVRLPENWAHYRVFVWHLDMPWRNNPTKEVVGKMKMGNELCGFTSVGQVCSTV
jgi:hypothetical protein